MVAGPTLTLIPGSVLRLVSVGGAAEKVSEIGTVWPIGFQVGALTPTTASASVVTFSKPEPPPTPHLDVLDAWNMVAPS